MTCEPRKRTLAHSHTCVRANRTSVQLCQRVDALQRGEDTTSCGLRVAHRLCGIRIFCKSLKSNNFHIDKYEFNIIHILRIAFSHAFSAYRRQSRRFDPPLRADRAGAFANDPFTHPHPPFRKQVLT